MADIISPTVLFVTFEQKDGQWLVKIPHAGGKNEHYEAPVSEELSLQFQPRQLTNEDGEMTAGIICYPLVSVGKGEYQDA